MWYLRWACKPWDRAGPSLNHCLVKCIWDLSGLRITMLRHNFGYPRATSLQKEHTYPNTVGSEWQIRETKRLGASSSIWFQCSSSRNLSNFHTVAWKGIDLGPGEIFGHASGTQNAKSTSRRYLVACSNCLNLWCQRWKNECRVNQVYAF